MASVQHPSPNRWVVRLASRSDPDSEVTVELRMSKTTADKLAHLEAARIAALNPDTLCSTTDDVGSAVLTISDFHGRYRPRQGTYERLGPAGTHRPYRGRGGRRACGSSLTHTLSEILTYWSKTTNFS